MRNFTAIHVEEIKINDYQQMNMQYAMIEEGKLIKSGKLLFTKLEDEESEKLEKTDNPFANTTSFLDHKDEFNRLLSEPLVGYDRSHKLVLDKYSDYYKMKMSFEYIDLKIAAQEKFKSLENYSLRSIAKLYNLNIKEYNKEDNYALLYAGIALNSENIGKQAFLKSIHLLRLEYYEKIRVIVNIGKIANSIAGDLLLWFEENIDITEQHFEVFVALRNFYKDNDIDEQEEIILLRMMNIEMKKIENMLK